jgi:hypothetical protein
MGIGNLFGNVSDEDRELYDEEIKRRREEDAAENERTLDAPDD